MFGIIAEPRSGSTTLYKIFKHIHNLNFIFEPFNSIKKYKSLQIDSEYYKGNNKESIVKFIQDGGMRYDGFKTIVYHIPIHYNQYLIDNSKSIYLYREDLFESTISYILAQKTNIWDNEYVNEEKTLALSIEHYNYILKNCFKPIIPLRHSLKFSNCLYVSYEQIYQQYKGYKIICDYFNIPEQSQSLSLINTGRYSLKTKYLISNIDELRKSFENIIGCAT